MFLRGQIGPCPQWLAELDCAAEFAAIEDNWIKPGKMLSFYNIPFGLSMIGPRLRASPRTKASRFGSTRSPTWSFSRSGHLALLNTLPCTPSSWPG
jgi:hypothetical protein